MKEFYPQNIEEWFNWLDKNHNSENEIWLLMYKKNTNKPTLSYDDALNTAICFGWVDVKIKKKNELSYYRIFKKRLKKSSWSEKNKARAVNMIDAGLMQEAGFKSINLAKENGEWDKVHSNHIDDESELMFINTLKNNPEAFIKFNLASPSHQKNFLRWISNAKRNKTKLNRIDKSIKMLLENKKFTD